MLLVDTSVWISHLREGDCRLAELLNDGEAACHPFIIGELACGNLKNRREILLLMRSLPSAIQAEHEEVLRFLEDNGLMGRGIGYIDAHLLASAVLSGIMLWTGDKKLRAAAVELGLCAPGK